MSGSQYDFRSALSGQPDTPAGDDEEEQAELLTALTSQQNSSPAGANAPLSLNLANGLLVMGNPSGSLEVDTTDQRVVIDPESPSEVGRRDGEVVLGSTDEATPLSSGQAVEGEALQPMVSSRLAPVSEGVPASSATVPEGEVTEPWEDPVHVVSVQEPDPSDLAEDFSSTKGTPLAEAVSSEFTPMTESIPATEAISVEESPDSADATGPVVTVDPETGETVILAEDLRITVGPENGQVRIEPSDENVPLAEGTDPITVDAGGMTMVIDPETGTLEVSPIEGELTDITVEVGDLRLVMDGETGEISVDPAEGSVSVDPETGLVTIEPTETGGKEDEGNEDATGGDEGAEGVEGAEDTGQDTADREQNSDGQGGHPSGEGQESETVPSGTGDVPQGEHGGEPDDQGGESNWLEALAPTETGRPASDPASEGVEDEGEGDGVAQRLAPGPDSSSEPTEQFSPVQSTIPGDSTHPTDTDTNTEENTDEETEGEGDGVAQRLAPGPDSGTTSPAQFFPTQSTIPDDGAQDSGGEGTDDEEEEDEESEEEEENEEDEEEDEEGNGDGGGDDDSSGGATGDGEGSKDKGTKIDLVKIAQFKDDFIVEVGDQLQEHTPNYYDYSEGGGSEKAPRVTRLGDPELLPVAGTLGSRLDQSMAMLYSILNEFDEEFTGIVERLEENMVTFDDLENDQALTAGQVAQLMDGSDSTPGGTESP